MVVWPHADRFVEFARIRWSRSFLRFLVRRMWPWSSAWDDGYFGRLKIIEFWFLFCVAVAAVAMVRFSMTDGSATDQLRRGVDAAWQSQLSDADLARFDSSTPNGFSWSRKDAGVEIMATVSRDACIAIASDLPPHTDSIEVVANVGSSTRIVRWMPASSIHGVKDAADVCGGGDITLLLRVAKPRLVAL